MDKNTITGFVLIAAVLFGFSWFSQPSAEEQQAQMRQDSIAAVQQQQAEAAKRAEQQKQIMAEQAALADTSNVLYDAMHGTARNITLQNKKIRLTVSTRGAAVRRAVVKGFSSIDGKNDVTLFDEKDQHLNYLLAGKDVNIRVADLFFQPSAQTDTTLTLTAQMAAGRKLIVTYRLGADYMLHQQFRAVGMEGLFAPTMNTMDIDWQQMCRQQERGFSFENRYSTLSYHKTDGGTDYLNEMKEKVDEPTEEKTDWIAFKNQFFSTMMIAKHDFQSGALLTSVPQEKGSGRLKAYGAKLRTYFDPTGRTPSEFDFYYGPNDYRLLKRVEQQCQFGKDLEMQRLVYLGWPIINQINRWFTIYVFDFLTAMNINMGIVLILITLLLKLITYPLVKKSYMSSAKMRVLKPKLEAATAHLNAPEDQMQKQQAMMAEYAKYGVSPLSGCLPMLIQMPIWVAMFNFVPNAIQLRGESFLWISDLSTYDPILEWGTNIWGIGDHLSLTCILFCGANLLYSWMTMRQQRDQMVGAQAQQMKMMQWMMFLMPLMFFFMFNDYSAGLNFYYFVSLFFSAAIMWTLRHTTDDAKLLAILERRYKENKANPKKMSGLAAKLQAMQQQQQELQRQREELARRRKGK